MKKILNNGAFEGIWFVKMKPLRTKAKAGWHSDRVNSEVFRELKELTPRAFLR